MEISDHISFLDRVVDTLISEELVNTYYSNVKVTSSHIVNFKKILLLLVSKQNNDLNKIYVQYYKPNDLLKTPERFLARINNPKIYSNCEIGVTKENKQKCGFINIRYAPLYNHNSDTYTQQEDVRETFDITNTKELEKYINLIVKT